VVTRRPSDFQAQRRPSTVMTAKRGEVLSSAYVSHRPPALLSALLSGRQILLLRCRAGAGHQGRWPALLTIACFSKTSPPLLMPAIFFPGGSRQIRPSGA